MKTFAQGAYGRKADRADWEKGKDFQLCATGQYFSNRDVPLMKKMGYTELLFVQMPNRFEPVFKVKL